MPGCRALGPCLVPARDPEPRPAGPVSAAPATRPRSVPPRTWNQERVLDALRDWAELVGRPPRIFEWCPASGRWAGKPSSSWALWEREYPRWPSPSTVMNHHTTWRAALLAAGLPGGRPPLELSLNERIEATLRMRAAGLSVRAIAAELGVNEFTPFTYLHATLCDCGRNYTVNGPRCTQCAGESKVRSEGERGRPQWTADTVIAAINEWARLEGRAPRHDEWASGRHASGRWRDEYPRWPPAGTVQRLHGSWAAALSAAGHSPAWRAFTDQEVIEALRADAAQLGRAPLQREWQQRPAGTPSVGAVISHFGAWNRGLRAAGLRVPHQRGKWTRERVIRELQRDAQKRGRAPSSNDWSNATRIHPVARTVEGLFGTWNAALRAAGLQPNVEPSTWTPTKVLDALRQLEQELGRQPISTDVRTPPAGYPSRAVIKRTLGSWRAACHQLGWSAPRRVRCDEQQMINALRAAAIELGSGFALQTYKATSGDRGWPSANAITARFGTWNAARQAAELPARRQQRGWRPDQLAPALRSLARGLRRTPTAHEWDQHASENDWPHSITVARRLGNGSWQRAAAAAGLTQRPRLNWTKEQTIALLRADAHKHGRPPRADDWLTPDQNRPTVHQVRRLFGGSWSAGLQAAGLETYRAARTTPHSQTSRCESPTA